MTPKGFPARKKRGGVGKLIGALIFGLLGCTIAYLGFSQGFKKAFEEDWVKTPCSVESFRIKSSKSLNPPFQPQVKFIYSWNGEAHTGSKVWPKKTGVDDFDKLHELIELERAHKIQECYVNPNDPAESALYPERFSALGSFVFGSFGLLFAAIGLGLLVSNSRSSRLRQKPISSKATRSESGSLFIVLFCGVFALVGFITLFMLAIPMWQKYLSAKSWQETPAKVVWSTVRSHKGDESTTYSADIFYQYSFNGRSYHSNSNGFFSGSSSGRSSKQAKVDKHPSGSRTHCFVNPEKPQQALLNRDFGWWAAWSLFPLPFIVIGVGGMFFGLGKKKANKSTRSSIAQLREPEDSPDPYRATGRETFSPGKKRVGWIAGSIGIAVFWNGIVSIFLYQVFSSWKVGEKDWFLTLFLVPFVLIGIGLILHIFYRILASFNPSPEITLTPGAIELGSASELKWSVQSGEHKFNNFSIYLVGVEEVSYRRGKDTVTEVSVFHEAALLETKDPRKIRSGSISVELPLDTMPSWESSNNAIMWTLHMCGEISFWPDVKDVYPVTVIPPSSHE